MISVILKYWKLAITAVLLIALGVQTVRLGYAQTAIAKLKVAAMQFELDIATARIAGVDEGVRQQRESQKIIDDTHKIITNQKIASIKRRATEAEARADRLAGELSVAEWGCLYKPLPEAVLKEFRQ